MENDWEKPYEEDGVTLGPDDALHREIEKTKTLKVVRLQLKDAVKKLAAENDSLIKTNQFLNQKLIHLLDELPEDDNSLPVQKLPKLKFSQILSIKWSFFLLLFNLTTTIILLIFLLKQ